jgi:hypothetical protein
VVQTVMNPFKKIWEAIQEVVVILQGIMSILREHDARLDALEADRVPQDRR